ncbi:sulfatase-like hydrolase/transferase [Paraflavisolibacter sp. H34]|uniref:sulfatase-like hydrolase/transferase n=1 Tax=Huijunlia imazamoxiresistens TaxID=3127457 RepID=UPI003016936B
MASFINISIHLLTGNLLRFFGLRIPYFLLVLTGIYVTAFLETAYFVLYHHSVSSSTIYILMETNLAEAKDFFSMYFNTEILLIGLALFIPFMVSVVYTVRILPGKRNRDLPLTRNRSKVFSIVVSVFLIAVLSITWYSTRLYRKNFGFIAGNAYRTYQRTARTYQFLISAQYGGRFTNVASDSLQEEVYVLIIGESTTRHHMGLYNYYRNTNPLLNARKKELLVYNNVVSPHTHTIPSLQKMLTMATYENPEGWKSGSLLQLMNKAGFATYWISNQCPIGVYETLNTLLSKSAYKSYFVNTAESFALTPHDEKLLKPLKQVLSATARKKFIVLHLLGTHGEYFNRYPPAFNRFHDEPVTPFRHEAAFRQINQYDNAVLYNDYFINNVLDLVKKENKKSWVIYLSDHGEDVYQTINRPAHGEENGTQPMYDVPFLVWRSDKYRQEDHHQYDVNRKYMTDDLIHTIADMSHVRFSQFEAARSLVHPQFSERKRQVDDKDYDERFRGK